MIRLSRLRAAALGLLPPHYPPTAPPSAWGQCRWGRGRSGDVKAGTQGAGGDAIFKRFPFPRAAFPCQPAAVLTLQKLGRALGEAGGQAGCLSLSREDTPSQNGPFAQPPWLRPSRAGWFRKD